MRLNGMTAVVTGGASGMGESMIYALAKEGASIVVVDRNVDGANAVATNVEKEGGKAICVKADVQSTEDLDAMADKAMDTLVGVNILVNNAGARVIKGFLEHTREDWDKMLGINLSGPFYCSQAIVPKMMTSGGGSIINVCSIASYMGRPNRCAYVALQNLAFLDLLTMAIDLAPKNIRVNGISPGMIASPLIRGFLREKETGPAWANDNLVGRWGNRKTSMAQWSFSHLTSLALSLVQTLKLRVAGLQPRHRWVKSQSHQIEKLPLETLKLAYTSHLLHLVTNQISYSCKCHQRRLNWLLDYEPDQHFHE